MPYIEYTRDDARGNEPSGIGICFIIFQAILFPL